jgi:hypothetical protein
VAWERVHKVFYEIKTRGFFGSGMFLAHLVCFKSVKKEMPGSLQSLLREYSDPMLWKIFLEFKNIILEENLSNKLKNSHENFSAVKVSKVSMTSCLDILKPLSSEIYREALYGRNFLWPFLNLLDNFSSKMVFLNSKKSSQSMRSEYSLRTWKPTDIYYFTNLRPRPKHSILRSYINWRFFVVTALLIKAKQQHGKIKTKTLVCL